MKTILVLTVGGSHQPILQSIQQNRPGIVHFICSEDTERGKGSYPQIIGGGKVLRSRAEIRQPDLPNIVTITNLATNQYEVHRIRHFDNLNDCYLTALRLLERLHTEHPDSPVFVDYTGGTKSMTAGLAAAALDDGRCEIQLVAGERRDLDKTADKTESVRPAQVWDAQATRRMRAAGELIARFDYAGAGRLLQETAARFASDQTIITLQRWISFCRAFDAWDRFDHETARRLLQIYRGRMDNYKAFLAFLVEGHGHGFERVEDLLMNAERRALQGRFDDAVGRLYRAVELTAQIWLQQKHSLSTGNLEIERVPSKIQGRLEKYRDEKDVIKIGLFAAWDLIASFFEDPLGKHFQSLRRKLMNFLTIRNNSLFAHGLQPISESEYKDCGPFVVAFVNEAIELATATLGKMRHTKLLQLPIGWD